MEGTRGGCLVEVQVAAEYLVRPLARKYHLDPHRLDHAGQQVHRRRGADGGHIVGFGVINHIADGIQPLLDGVVDFVMDGADVLGHLPRFVQIGRPIQPHGERVQSRPPGPRAGIILNPHRTEPLGNGRDDGGIEPARKQHAVWHIGHHLAFYRRFQGTTQLFCIGRIVLHGIEILPLAPVPPLHAGVAAPVAVAGQEGFVALALAFQGFQFRCYVDGAVGIVPDVQGDHADGIAGDQEGVLLLVVQHEGENAVQFVQEVRTLVAIQGKDDLAVAARAEIIFPGIAPPDFLVVVNLSVHGQNLPPVGRKQGLPARFGIDDAETFVGKDGAAATPDTAPIRASVPDFPAHFQGLTPQLGALLTDFQDTGNSTHSCFPPLVITAFAVFINIQTFVFDPRLDPQAVCFLDAEEQQHTANGRPKVDNGDAEALYAQEMPAAAVQQAAVRSQHTRQDRPQDAAHPVYGRCAHRVVDMQFMVDEFNGIHQHGSANQSDYDGAAGRYHVAAGGNAHQACQDAVQG